MIDYSEFFTDDYKMNSHTFPITHKTDCINVYEYGILNSIIITFWTFTTGIFFGLFLISHILYSKLGVKLFNYHENENDETEIEEVDYEDKYPIKTDIEHTNTNPSPYTYLVENTPDGMVFFQYNVDEEGFYYWTNNNISFQYLETVARKYVNMFHCKDFYIERKINQESDSESDREEEHESEETDNNETKLVEKESEHDAELDNQIKQEEDKVTKVPFAKLKKYNNNSVPNSIPNSNHKNKNNSSQQVEERSCKFIKKGKISDLQMLNKQEIETPRQKMDFQSFKKMFF